MERKTETPFRYSVFGIRSTKPLCEIDCILRHFKDWEVKAPRGKQIDNDHPQGSLLSQEALPSSPQDHGRTISHQQSRPFTTPAVG